MNHTDDNCTVMVIDLKMAVTLKTTFKTSANNFETTLETSVVRTTPKTSLRVPKTTPKTSVKNSNFVRVPSVRKSGTPVFDPSRLIQNECNSENRNYIQNERRIVSKGSSELRGAQSVIRNYTRNECSPRSSSQGKWRF